jgi:uncharacterized oxidoreductase
MSVKNIDTVLILGATSGIGEAFTHYFHAQGKKIVAAGRNESKLASLKSTLSGVETFRIDIEDIANLEANIQKVVTAFPTLDTIFVVSGIMKHFSFLDASGSSTDSIVSEVTTNLTAPLVIARTIVPHLLSLKRQTTFVTVTSGLAYIPLPLYPVYDATKAGIHTFNVVLRAQLAGTSVNVIELAPPYVDTNLDAAFRDKTASHGPPPMPLQEYMDKATAKLEEGGHKEVAVGFAELGQGAWRKAFDPFFEQFGIKG